MELNFGIDDRPPLKDTFLYGIQWFITALPIIIIIGVVVRDLQGSGVDSHIYLQRLIFVMAMTLFIQLIWGHGLPLIVGPSAALLVGITVVTKAELNAAYTAITLGGLMVFLLGITGAFRYLQRIFTPRVVVAIIFLISVTLMPTVIRFILWPGGGIFSLAFFLCLVMLAVILHGCLKGMMKATALIWVMIGGSLLYYAFYPPLRAGELMLPLLSLKFLSLGGNPFSFDGGVFVSFFFCFFALTINEVASVQSVNELLHPPKGVLRVSRSLTVTGLANLCSGLLGVIGPVNYSLSPGMISSSRCASRFPLFVTASLLCFFALSPHTIGLVNYIPPPVIGSVLAYLLGAQAVAGLTMWWEEEKKIDFDGGLVVMTPVVMATIVAFLPPSFLEKIPSFFRPVAGSGFVVGLIGVLVLDRFFALLDSKNRIDDK
jgi:xanthine/uracil permease